jgi:hypothetical protein
MIAPLTRALDHGCDPARDTETAVRRSPLRVIDVSHHEVPALPGVTVPYVVGRAVS